MQLVEVLKTTRQRTLHAKCWENNIVLGKKNVRNNFHIKEKLDFVFRGKKRDDESIESSSRLPLPLPDSSSFELPFADRDDQNLLQD